MWWSTRRNRRNLYRRGSHDGFYVVELSISGLKLVFLDLCGGFGRTLPVGGALEEPLGERAGAWVSASGAVVWSVGAEQAAGSAESGPGSGRRACSCALRVFYFYFLKKGRKLIEKIIEKK